MQAEFREDKYLRLPEFRPLQDELGVVVDVLLQVFLVEDTLVVEHAPDARLHDGEVERCGHGAGTD